MNNQHPDQYCAATKWCSVCVSVSPCLCCESITAGICAFVRFTNPFFLLFSLGSVVMTGYSGCTYEWQGSRESSIKETRISRGETLGMIIRSKTSTKFCREDRMSVTSGSMLTCDWSDEEGHFIFLKNPICRCYFRSSPAGVQDFALFNLGEIWWDR
jgi:hypothetical protein